MKESRVETFIWAFLKAYYQNQSGKNAEGRLPEVNYVQLTQRLTELGLIGFFHWALSSGRVAAPIPRETLRHWQEISGRVGLHNAFYENHGARLIQYLSDEGIRCIMLKGFAHMEKLYGVTWLRPVSDIDILIDKNDYARVKDYLFSSGFTCQRNAGFRGTEQEYVEAHELYQNEISFVKRVGSLQFQVDLHWDVIGLREGSPLESIYPIDRYPWFEHTVRIPFGQGVAECLALDMHFVHSVLHFAINHQFQGAKWFVDLCQFCALLDSSLDWDFVDSIVVESNSRKAFGVALRLVSEVTGETGAASRQWKRFWSGGGLPGEYQFYKRRVLGDRSHSGTYGVHLLMPNGLLDKCRVLSYILFSEDAIPEWRVNDKRRWPAPLQPLYILYRLVEERTSGRLGTRY